MHVDPTRHPAHAAPTCRQGSTALIYAANEGHLEAVQALVKAGADVKAKNKNVSLRPYDAGLTWGMVSGPIWWLEGVLRQSFGL